MAIIKPNRAYSLPLVSHYVKENLSKIVRRDRNGLAAGDRCIVNETMTTD